MRARTIVAVIAGVTLLGGGVSAEAAAKKPKPKPICNLVPDAKGDVMTGNQVLDITSADVNADSKTITVAIRLAKVSTDKNPLSPTGAFYEFAFAYDGIGKTISGYIDPTGKAAFNGTGKMTLDTAHNEIRLTSKVDDLTGHPTFRPGGLFTNIVVRADLYNATGSSLAILVPIVGDSATVNKAYAIGTPSCVKLGS
jgi:hypothetical protein